MSACKRHRHICFRGGSAAGEQQARLLINPDDGGRSGMQNEREEKEKRERERENERERERERENEREREREKKERERKRKRERERERGKEREKRKKQKLHGCSCQSHVTCINGHFLYFSHQSTSWNPRLRMKTKDSATSFPIRPATLGCHSLWPEKAWPLCAWRFASTGTATRELDLRCSNWTRTFPQRVDNYLAPRGKMRWQNVCSSNCSFTLKENTDGDMVRHKSLKLKNHKKSKELAGRRSAEVLQSSRSVRTRNALPRSRVGTLLRYSMVTTRWIKELSSPSEARK